MFLNIALTLLVAPAAFKERSMNLWDVGDGVEGNTIIYKYKGECDVFSKLHRCFADSPENH